IYENTYSLINLFVSDLLENNYCVFDLEGTGINFKTDYITQIAVLSLQSNKESSNVFNSLVYSPKKIPYSISQMTGIFDKDLINAPDFNETYQNFRKFIGNSILVTQAGYEYDLPLL